MVGSVYTEAGAELDAHVDEFKAQGFTVFRNFYSAEQVRAIRSVVGLYWVAVLLREEAQSSREAGFLPAGTQRKSISIFFLFFLTVTL